jgi:predicted dehydrogenase
MPAVLARDDAHIVGLADIEVGRALALRDEFGLVEAAIGSDGIAMMNDLAPDVVFDCTPPHVHRTITEAALLYGCHVLGEKPMAESMKDAREMVRSAAAANRRYAVIQNRRFQPRIERFRALLRSAAIGPLTTLHADFFIGAHFGGFRDTMEHVLLLDMAIHTFDQARHISGCDPVSVICHEWNPPGSWYRHGASAVAVFEMTGGVVFSYRGSWCAEGPPTTWESQWRAIGTKGTATWDGGDALSAHVAVEDDGFMRLSQPVSLPPTPDVVHTDHAGVINDFLDALRTGREPLTICTDNIRSLAMVHGAIETARSGRRIAIELDHERTIRP